MLHIKAGQTCPHGSCPHSEGCWGMKVGRTTDFSCDFVKDDGSIKENVFRNPLDKTGKMKVIMEDV